MAPRIRKPIPHVFLGVTQLAEAVEDTLGLGGYRKGIWQGKSRKVVKIIIDTITKALQRGERVTIAGFGAFYLQPQPSRWFRNFYTNEFCFSKPYIKVKFIPAESLTRSLDDK